MKNKKKIYNLLTKYLPKEVLHEVAVAIAEAFDEANKQLEKHYCRKLQLMKLKLLKKKQ